MIYTGDKLKEISFPIGGIGSGSIGIAGNGLLCEWEIFNRPNKCSANEYSFFTLVAEYPDGKRVAKILHGDWTKDLMGKTPRSPFWSYGTGFGHGASKITMCGFPHFKNVVFDGKFPFAELTFTDEDFPATVVMKAFNPFIPLDADNSSIPAAFFDIKILGRKDGVKYTCVLSVTNPFAKSENKKIASDKYTAVKLSNYGVDPDDKEYGDITVAVKGDNTLCQEYWYRGQWQDGITAFWYDCTRGSLNERHYDEPSKHDVCSVGAVKTVNNGESESTRFIVSWNVPNNYNYWSPLKDGDGKDVTWKNYYATLFENSEKSAFYGLDNWDGLEHKTELFSSALHSSTLDKTVIEAITSTLSVLKTATVWRLEDGTFYGWEGLHETIGCCEGTCTHVWSYVYSLCFLFPELERSLRNTEFDCDTDENGRMYFRTALPLKQGFVEEHPCVDGQMATVIKIYRDWKLTGNSRWLKDNWKNIKKILEYAWSENNPFCWDRDKDGVLEGMQHHTLDMELFGPSSWLEGMYLGALKAASEMADFLGDSEKSREYAELFKNGYNYTKENLFNGEYFYHKVDLENKEYTEKFNCPHYWNSEYGQIKYQISTGCEIDQMLGQWHASLCGLGDIFDSSQRKIALQSMMKYNFKESFRNVANTWRSFALNDEKGTVICDYPDETQKPVIPIPYCEECMTGFEYAFAGLLATEGYIDECHKVVKAIRDRYDGEKRNPWNEMECGSNYARAMASYALLPIFSGFEYDVPKKHIGFAPIVDGDFKCFWSLGTGWGNFVLNSDNQTVEVLFGELELESIKLPQSEKIKEVYVDGENVPFKVNDGCVCFKSVKIKKSLCCKMQ